MRKPFALGASFLLALVLTIVGTLVTSAATLTTDAGTAPSPDATRLTSMVVNLVNIQRAQAGLPPVQAAPPLQQSAQTFATSLASNATISHVGPDGSTMVSRDEAAGYLNWSFLAENLAAGQSSPDQVVAAWLASPPHRANLLSSDVTEVGAGYAYNGGWLYHTVWVLDLGARSP
jgi:uncharacterized protein YkwD